MWPSVVIRLSLLACAMATMTPGASAAAAALVLALRGVQFAAGNSFPADGSRWMFTLHAGAGWLIPLEHNRQANVALRYLHVSNAGLVDNNSGYDVVHLILGVRWGLGP